MVCWGLLDRLDGLAGKHAPLSGGSVASEVAQEKKLRRGLVVAAKAGYEVPDNVVEAARMGGRGTATRRVASWSRANGMIIALFACLATVACGGHERDCHHSDVPLKHPSKRVGGISACGGGGSGGGGGGGEKTAKEKQQAKRILELEEQIRNQGKGKGGDKPGTYSEAAQSDSAEAKLKKEMDFQ